MRHYDIDSAHAAARVLSLALMADGAPAKIELDCLHRMRALEEIGIDDQLFESVLRNFCEDIEQSIGYFEALNYDLPSELIDALLGEVRDPHKQSELLRKMVEIAVADGCLSAGEKHVLARAVALWGEPACGPAPARPHQPL
jgi:uncharacterized tellurite resistance protein B-like protein